MSSQSRVGGVSSITATIGGKPLTFRPMSVGAYAALEDYFVSLKGNPLADAIQASTNLPPAQQRAVIDAGLAAMSRLRLISVEDMALFEATIQCTAFKIWSCLPDHHTEFPTPSSVLSFLLSLEPADYTLLLETVRTVNDEAALGNLSSPPETVGEAGPTSIVTSPGSTIGRQIK